MVAGFFFHGSKHTAGLHPGSPNAQYFCDPSYFEDWPLLIYVWGHFMAHTWGRFIGRDG